MSPRKTPTKAQLLSEDQEFLIKMGKRMKELRIKAGYTSAETFAYEAGISRTMYGNYERGTDMRVTNLRKVIKALGISLEQFFSEGFE